jgi:hypothetical protein
MEYLDQTKSRPNRVNGYVPSDLRAKIQRWQLENGIESESKAIAEIAASVLGVELDSRDATWIKLVQQLEAEVQRIERCMGILSAIDLDIDKAA